MSMPAGQYRQLTRHEQLRNKLDASSCRTLGFVFWVSLHFTRSGLSRLMEADIVVEKGSEYILAHTGPRELDGRPQGMVQGIPVVLGASVTGSHFSYITFLVRVRTNINQ